MLVYYLIMPLAIKFFLSFETTGSSTTLPIQLEAKVNEYLSLVMKLIFAFVIFKSSAFSLSALITSCIFTTASSYFSFLIKSSSFLFNSLVISSMPFCLESCWISSIKEL